MVIDPIIFIYMFLNIQNWELLENAEHDHEQAIRDEIIR